MIRVTYLITDSGVGGTEKMLAELVLNLDRNRFAPELIALKEPGETGRMLAEKGIEVKSIGLPGKVSSGYGLKLPGAFLRLRSMLAEPRPDILHCFLFQANFLGRIAANTAGVPVNISSLRVEEKERSSHAVLERITGSLVTAYTAVCDQVRDFGIQKMGIPPDKMITIPNGIRPELYDDKDRVKIRKEFGIEINSPLIGTIGRIHRQKGIDILLKAVASVKGKFPDLKVIIVGEGPEKKNLQALAQELGLLDSVIFTGLRRDIPDLLAAFDLFVLASRWEGMPNVILEAMAAGRAVVATDTGGAGELVKHGDTGLLVPVENIEALSEAILRLLEKKPELSEMGEKARQRVKEHYTITKMVEKNQELYERLMKDVRNLR